MVDFDNYITNNYGHNYKQFNHDTKELFKNLQLNNTILTNSQIDKYIDKIVKGKSRSILNDGGGHLYIDELVDRHNLSPLQVNKILNTLLCDTRRDYYYSKNTKNMLWVNKLLNHGYIFTDKQINILADLDFDIEKIINKKDIKTIDDLYNICKSRHTKLQSIVDICKKNNLIPDNICFDYTLHIEDCAKKSYTKTHTYKISDVIDSFIECNFKPDSETISILIKNNINRQIDYSNIIKIMNNGAELTINHINDLLSVKTFIHNGLCELLKNAHTKKIPLDVSHFKKLISRSNKYDYNENIEEDNNENSKSCITKPVNAYNNIYAFFINTIKIEITPELCDYVCECHDNRLLKYLIIHNLFKLTNKSLSMACENLNMYAIKEIINMKGTATKENILKLPYGVDKKIVATLIMSGLLVDYEVVDILYSKGFIFEDLTTYGLEYNDEIYYIIHKNLFMEKEFKGTRPVSKKNKVTISYLEKFDKKLFNFRQMFYDNTLGEIKEHMEKNNLVPDQFCFDNSNDNIENDDVMEWLKNTYNFKPTIITLLRIDEPFNRISFYNEHKNDIIMSDYKQLYVKNVTPAVEPSNVPTVEPINAPTIEPIKTPAVEPVNTPAAPKVKKIKIKPKLNIIAKKIDK